MIVANVYFVRCNKSESDLLLLLPLCLNLVLLTCTKLFHCTNKQFCFVFVAFSVFKKHLNSFFPQEQSFNYNPEHNIREFATNLHRSFRFINSCIYVSL